MEAGNDEETRQFYSKGILVPIWGDKQFKDRVLSRTKQSKTEVAKRSMRSIVSLTLTDCKNGSAILWSVHQSNYDCYSRERTKKYPALDCDEALSGLFRQDVK